MIKFNGTYTPEWQEELNDTKLGQLCGNRDVLKYTLRVDRPSTNLNYVIGLFFVDREGDECYIRDEVDPAFVSMLYGHPVSEKTVLLLAEQLQLFNRAWEYVYG